MDSAPATPLDSELRADSGANSTIEREEHAATVSRLRTVLLLGLALWAVALGGEWVTVRYVEPGSLWYFAALRSVLVVALGAVVWRLSRPPLPTPGFIRAVDAGLFNLAALLAGLMAWREGGLLSPLTHGMTVVLTARAVALPGRWNRAVWGYVSPVAVYQLTLLAGALVSSRVHGQLADASVLARFGQHLVFQVMACMFATVGGHAHWALRRQVFEARLVGRYKLKSKLGAGAMGEVWLAYHPALKRDVAIKLLKPGDASPAAVARFEREVRATSELAHPNTVRVFDFGVTDDGMWFYAMEHLSGETLAALVAREGALPPERAVRLIHQAARALAEAHRRGIIHRDLKPENLFVTSMGGEADFMKVLDFGVAKLMVDGSRSVSASITRQDAIIGTPLYMAPEQGMSEEVDARSDVYALGAVLFFALTGRAPFPLLTAAAIIVSHVSKAPPTVASLAPGPISEGLEAIVQRCLAKRPDARFATASELADALKDLRVTAAA